MTGFLCALGGVCLSQHSKPCGPTTYSPPMGPMSERKYSMVSVGVCEVSNAAAGASATCSSSSSTETPLGRFLDRLLVLLVCGHERVGLHVRTNVKELLGLELSPVLYHMLFNKLRNSIGSFFDTGAGEWMGCGGGWGTLTNYLNCISVECHSREFYRGMVTFLLIAAQSPACADVVEFH